LFGVNFGIAVAISGKRIVVGADLDDTEVSDGGAAYVYDLGAEAPETAKVILRNPLPSRDDHFGASVGMDGQYVIVGVPGDSAGAGGAGSAYLFDLDRPTRETAVSIFNNPEPHEQDFFGAGVAIAGNHLVIAAPSLSIWPTPRGAVYGYDLTAPSPTQPVLKVQTPFPNLQTGAEFGRAVATYADRVVVGSPQEFGSGSPFCTPSPEPYFRRRPVP
jgi:hypothetical protein